MGMPLMPHPPGMGMGMAARPPPAAFVPQYGMQQMPQYQQMQQFPQQMQQYPQQMAQMGNMGYGAQPQQQQWQAPYGAYQQQPAYGGYQQQAPPRPWNPQQPYGNYQRR